MNIITYISVNISGLVMGNQPFCSKSSTADKIYYSQYDTRSTRKLAQYAYNVIWLARQNGGWLHHSNTVIITNTMNTNLSEKKSVALSHWVTNVADNATCLIRSLSVRRTFNDLSIQAKFELMEILFKFRINFKRLPFRYLSTMRNRIQDSSFLVANVKLGPHSRFKKVTHRSLASLSHELYTDGPPYLPNEHRSKKN